MKTREQVRRRRSARAGWEAAERAGICSRLTSARAERPWSPIVKQGDHGDAMFLVLEGEARVRLVIDGKESTLATLGSGDFFGEVSLFDQGPRWRT